MYHKIMIVDDSKVSRMILKKTISEITSDVTIIEASNADEAVEKLSSEEIEAAILDFHMPGLNGLDLAEKLINLQPALVITMLTANIQNEIKDRAKALNIGYLAKPVNKAKIETFIMG